MTMKRIAFFIIAVLICGSAKAYKIESISVNPAASISFGQSVTVTVTYCANQYVTCGIAIAVSDQNTFRDAMLPADNQIFLVSAKGINTEADVPAVMSSDRIGYEYAPVIGTPDCVECGGSSMTGTRFTRQYLVTIPEEASFSGTNCNMTQLYFLAAINSQFEIIADWWDSADPNSCKKTTSVSLLAAPKANAIKAKIEGRADNVGDVLIFKFPVNYSRCDPDVASFIPQLSNGSLEFVEAGPVAYATPPIVGVTSGSITWNLPGMTSYTPEYIGEVWFSAKVKTAITNGTAVYVSASSKVTGDPDITVSDTIYAGQPRLSLVKSCEDKNYIGNDTVSYTLDYEYDGTKIGFFESFDRYAANTVFNSSTGPSGWTMVQNNATYGTWTITQDAASCSETRRYIKASVASDQYPAMLVTAPVFCEGGIITADVMIGGTTAGPDAAIYIRSNGTSKYYQLLLSTDLGGNGYFGFLKNGSILGTGLTLNPGIFLNKWVSVKILVSAPYTFSAKVWPKGAPEPENYMITATDTSPTGMGCNSGDTWRAGVIFMGSTTWPGRTNSYDNFMIKPHTPAAQPDVIVRDTIPADIAFQWASSGYSHAGQMLSWVLPCQTPLPVLKGSLTWSGILSMSALIVTNTGAISIAAPAIYRYSNDVIIGIGTPTVTPTLTATSTFTVTRTYTPTRTSTPTRTQTVSIADAVDLPSGTWATGGSSSWFGQYAQTTYDGDAAQSGLIADGQESWVELRSLGSVSVTFVYRIDAFSDDRIQVAMDGGAAIMSYSGVRDWTEYTVDVPAGSHDIRWSYIKTGAGTSAGADAVWLDNVRLNYATATYTSTVTLTPTRTMFVTATPSGTPTPAPTTAPPSDSKDTYVFPQPVKNKATFVFTASEAGEAEVCIYTFANKRAGCVKYSVLAADNASVEMDTSGLKPGVYYYRLKLKGNSGIITEYNTGKMLITVKK
jgi:hypothetical protein